MEFLPTPNAGGPVFLAFFLCALERSPVIGTPNHDGYASLNAYDKRLRAWRVKYDTDFEVQTPTNLKYDTTGYSPVFKFTIGDLWKPDANNLEIELIVSLLSLPFESYSHSFVPPGLEDCEVTLPSRMFFAIPSYVIISPWKGGAGWKAITPARRAKARAKTRKTAFQGCALELLPWGPRLWSESI